MTFLYGGTDCQTQAAAVRVLCFTAILTPFITKSS